MAPPRHFRIEAWLDPAAARLRNLIISEDGRECKGSLGVALDEDVGWDEFAVSDIDDKCCDRVHLDDLNGDGRLDKFRDCREVRTRPSDRGVLFRLAQHKWEEIKRALEEGKLRLQEGDRSPEDYISVAYLIPLHSGVATLLLGGSRRCVPRCKTTPVKSSTIPWRQICDRKNGELLICTEAEMQHPYSAWINWEQRNESLTIDLRPDQVFGAYKLYKDGLRAAAERKPEDPPSAREPTDWDVDKE